MSAASDFLEAALLEWIFNGGTYNTYVALFLSDPTDAGVGTEVSGGSYARIRVYANGGGSPAWNTSVVDGSGYLIDNADDIIFATATADWGTITYFGIYDAASGGNLLVHGALTSSKTIASGEDFKFAAGDLNVKAQ